MMPARIKESNLAKRRERYGGRIIFSIIGKWLTMFAYYGLQ
jgi:hypothetical protein